MQPLDVQPLLDAGLLSCLLWVLHAIFGQPGLENAAASAENTAHVVEADSEPLSKLMVKLMKSVRNQGRQFKMITGFKLLAVQMH